MVQPLSADSSWKSYGWSTRFALMYEADLIPDIHLEILAADASRTKMEVVQVSDSESEDSSID